MWTRLCDAVPPCCGTYLVTIRYTHKNGRSVDMVKEAEYDYSSNQFSISSTNSSYSGTGAIKTSKLFSSCITAWAFMPEAYKESLDNICK